PFEGAGGVGVVEGVPGGAGGGGDRVVGAVGSAGIDGGGGAEVEHEHLGAEGAGEDKGSEVSEFGEAGFHDEVVGCFGGSIGLVNRGNRELLVSKFIYKVSNLELLACRSAGLIGAVAPRCGVWPGEPKVCVLG